MVSALQGDILCEGDTKTLIPGSIPPVTMGISLETIRWIAYAGRSPGSAPAYNFRGSDQITSLSNARRSHSERSEKSSSPSRMRLPGRVSRSELPSIPHQLPRAIRASPPGSGVASGIPDPPSLRSDIRIVRSGRSMPDTEIRGVLFLPGPGEVPAVLESLRGRGMD